MHPDLEPLMNLQRLDNEAKRLRDEMIALPKLVDQLSTRAQATVGQRALILDLIAKEDAARRRQESDVKDLEAKVARLRKQMDLATTTVQLTAYEHEIDFARKEIARLEDAELESMERSEQFDTQRKLADAAVEAAQQKHSAERERAAVTLAAHKIALAQLDAQRLRQREGIGEAALSTYDRIARAKGTGVAEVANQKCSACQMLVRPQRWNDLRDRDNHELMTCESCGRLLWYDTTRDSPGRKPALQEKPQESIAARIVRGL